MPTNLNDARNKVPLNQLINELGLSGCPASVAHSCIENYINVGQIFMYTDMEVFAAQTDVPPEEVHETQNDGRHITLLLCGKEYGELISDNLTLDQISFHVSDGSLCVYCYQFKSNGLDYQSCDESSLFINFVQISVENVYFDKNDIASFLQGISAPKPHRTLPRPSDPGLMKAIALLAREKADSTETKKFRHGKTVNARAFQKHLITLANKYKVKSTYLKTIEDKVNDSLDILDLNELKTP